jgi:hypothetical protein
MSMGSDTEVPQIPVDMHMAIVISAQITALADTAETSEKAQAREELNGMLAGITASHDNNKDSDDRISVDDDIWSSVD